MVTVIFREGFFSVLEIFVVSDADGSPCSRCRLGSRCQFWRKLQLGLTMFDLSIGCGKNELTSYHKTCADVFT